MALDKEAAREKEARTETISLDSNLENWSNEELPTIPLPS